MVSRLTDTRKRFVSKVITKHIGIRASNLHIRFLIRI